MNEISETQQFFEFLVNLAISERWDDYLHVLDELLDETPDHPVLRANRCFCRYHLGEAATVLPEIDYLLGDWPPDYPRLSLIALGILCTDRTGDLEARRNFVFQLAEETAIRQLLAWDMPTVPRATDGASVFETNSPGPLMGILEEVRNESGWDEVQRILLDTLIAHYKERQERAEKHAEENQSEDMEDSPTRVVDEASELRVLRVLEALAEERANPASPAARLITDLDDFDYGLIDQRGHKTLYMGESKDEQILIHIWNYEVPLPAEYDEYDIDHRQAMAAWFEHAREVAEAFTEGGGEDEAKGVFATPIFIVDLGDCGGIVGLY